MADMAAVHLALRNRALTLLVAETNAAHALAATTNGYTRATGSFLTEGFIEGQELVPSGFAANPADVVESVTALELRTVGSRSAEVAAGGRQLKSGMPATFVLENRAMNRKQGRPYVVEEFSPSTAQQITSPPNGGVVEETGQYFLTWYGLTTVGPIRAVGVAALRAGVEKLRKLFAPGTKMSADGGYVVVRGSPAPQSGQVTNVGGWAALQLKISWRISSNNAITP